MNNSLYDTIESIQNGDTEKIIYIIGKFNPTIKKYSKRLKYEEAETDLIIDLIEMIQVINLSNFDKKNEGSLVKYIYNNIKNKHIDLFRKYVKSVKEEVEINLDIIETPENYNIEENIFIEDLLNKLPELQRKIIKEKYINDHSDAEIAKALNKTRQAVNKTKNKALKTLRNYLEKISYSA